MSGFRAKVMTVAEWTRFQDLYEEFFTAAGGDKRLALFSHREPHEESSTLLIPMFQSELVEALAPDGWHDAENVTDVSWKLLVGNASANEDFGLTGIG